MDNIFHATCIALRREVSGSWAGVLIRGPSGSGKSDLALRLLHDRPQETRLVADDYIELALGEGVLIGTPPVPIAGKLEVRGIGIVSMAHLSKVSVKAVVSLVEPAKVTRLPEPALYAIKCAEGAVDLPHFSLAPFEASAPAKFVMAMHKAEIWDS